MGCLRAEMEDRALLARKESAYASLRMFGVVKCDIGVARGVPIFCEGCPVS